MSIDEILIEMDELLEDSINLPFSGGKRMVDVERIRDLMGEIKLNLPGEVRDAQKIVRARADIIAAANKEADGIVRRAEERAALLVSEAEVVKASQAKAAELLANAQQQSREMRKQVLEYCDGMLRQSEEVLAKKARDIREVRGSLTRGGSGNAGNTAK